MKAAQRLSLLLAAAIYFAAPTVARADVIFSQTFTANAGFRSDLDLDFNGNQDADNFGLQVGATARSVLWRGIYVSGNTPTAPLYFTLFIYGDSGGFPDQSNILSQTDVSFSLAQITDTGEDFIGRDIYEFTANIDPVALSSGTPYWFSVLADTSNDVDDNFSWSGINNGDGIVVQSDVTGMGGFIPLNNNNVYFQINDAAMAVVPVPAAAWLALPLLGMMAIKRRAFRR